MAVHETLVNDYDAPDGGGALRLPKRAKEAGPHRPPCLEWQSPIARGVTHGAPVAESSTHHRTGNEKAAVGHNENCEPLLPKQRGHLAGDASRCDTAIRVAATPAPPTAR